MPKIINSAVTARVTRLINRIANVPFPMVDA
jgi:hypothetical protein